MDLKIERPSPTCSVCARPFRDEEELTTGLVPVDEEGSSFSRQDICNQCFPEYEKSGLHCFWTSTHSERKRSPLLDSDVLWQVFHASYPKAEDDEQAREFAYVAALGLMRLKQLVLESTKRTDAAEYLVMRTKGKASQREEFSVRDPNLDEKGVERVQDSLADVDMLDESLSPASGDAVDEA